jgi:hypothetical protein
MSRSRRSALSNPAKRSSRIPTSASDTVRAGRSREANGGAGNQMRFAIAAPIQIGTMARIPRRSRTASTKPLGGQTTDTPLSRMKAMPIQKHRI